ncbi:esterase-like activity of phytase family protein [Roseateles depolymerans]|uniref:Uncharacterized protein n=1 Tax=Roseateles depolymerans TaxID=76731 RepID=A0A0U3MGK7_9BURK|nr:esterase-like activity of phytase family protein [Roseateles depolymerans]ALV07529.1 hypothetical protein RD2015_3068 [Roseateles depolymerans]REG22255.1 hypothetical protein DES44_1399 [Roseateles depolymerans]
MRVRFLSSTRALAASLVAAAALMACGGGDGVEPVGTADVTVSSLRLIGQQILPRRLDYAGTVVGGLSGVDYDAKSDSFVFISDDRTTTDSAGAPRLYTAKLAFDANSFTAVSFTGVVTMKQPDGSVYPKVPDAKVADPESVRIDPVTGNWVWLSEGDRTLTSSPVRVINPFIREITPQGTHVREYSLPPMFQMSAQETGPRGNLTFEGLSFSRDGRSAWVIMEGALIQDGPLPTPTSGSASRLTRFDRASGVADAQFVYPIDPVQAAPSPAGQFTVNGPTEILALSATRFLVLERSFSVGVVGNQVRLYEIDVANSTNVLASASLTGAVPVTKRLVLDFETLKAPLGGIANLEGITFGPMLANGKRSLVVVADDNFPTADSATDRNQILVFEIQP